MLVDKALLFQQLAQWSLDDLRTLCFYFQLESPELKVAYDNLAGETVNAKAQSLILHLQKFEAFDSWAHCHRILQQHFPFQDTTIFFSIAQVTKNSITNSPQTLQASSFIGIEWIPIPAGKFWMGDDGEIDESPCHLVDLPTYWISKTPITNIQYLKFVQATSHRAPNHWAKEWLSKRLKIPPSKENHPVVHVNWYDALAFARWVGGQIGRIVLLPSEAEWEKAARGGEMLPTSSNPLPKRQFPWGDYNFDRCNTMQSGVGDTTHVNKYPQGASPYGVLDMSGNVDEWTRSLTKPYPYIKTDGRESLDDAWLATRVLRGGSWVSNSYDARLTSRTGSDPDSTKSYHIGFRLVIIDI